MIPHIIHQIWFQGEDNIPKKYPNYSKSWKEMNPKFKYIFWDGEKMEKLIKEKYPWFLKRYNEYPNMIQRIDSAKYFIMHQYGGILPDLDCECVKPITPFLKGKSFLACILLTKTYEKLAGLYLYSVTSLKQFLGEFFQNGFLGSPKGHPCWSILHKNLLKEDLKEKWYETYIKNIFRTVGPSIFTRSIYEYGIDKIDIIDKKFIDPVDWCDFKGDCDTRIKCRIKYPDAYSIQHYGTRNPEFTWMSISNSWSSFIGLFFCKYKDRLVSFTTMFILIILAYVKSAKQCDVVNFSCIIKNANTDFIIILLTASVYFTFLH